VDRPRAGWTLFNAGRKTRVFTLDLRLNSREFDADVTARFSEGLVEGHRRGAAMETTQQDDERELAQAILTGAHRRKEQSFGSYFGPEGGSCALGAAYEGVYLLPRDAHDAMPRRLDRFFHCLENVSRRCPAGCKKQIPIGAMIVHLNDDHRWTREQIADWLEHPPTAVQRNRSQQQG
jgi:hypothetical protein